MNFFLLNIYIIEKKRSDINKMKVSFFRIIYRTIIVQVQFFHVIQIPKEKIEEKIRITFLLQGHIFSKKVLEDKILLVFKKFLKVCCSSPIDKIKYYSHLLFNLHTEK